MATSNKGASKSTMTNNPESNPDSSLSSSQQRQRAYDDKVSELKQQNLGEHALEVEIHKWMDSLRGSNLCPSPSTSADSSPQERRWAGKEKESELKARGQDDGAIGSMMEQWLMGTEWFKALQASTDADFLAAMGGKFEHVEGTDAVFWTRP